MLKRKSLTMIAVFLSIFFCVQCGNLTAPQEATSNNLDTEQSPQWPCILWIPLSHDFGNVPVGEMVSSTFVLKNMSVNCHTITDIYIDGDSTHFEVSGRETPYNLSGGGSEVYIVTYIPQALGHHQILINADNRYCDNTGSWTAVSTATGHAPAPWLLQVR